MESISDLDEAHVVDLLGKDVAATLGPAHLAIVRTSARNNRRFAGDPSSYMERVVEDVQQYVHDCFIDTAWPACPAHPNHPMWFHAGWWVADGERRVRLGELGTLLT